MVTTKRPPSDADYSEVTYKRGGRYHWCPVPALDAAPRPWLGPV